MRAGGGNSPHRNSHLHALSTSGCWLWGLFDTLTLILWPSAFYLTVLQAKEPITVTVAVWALAIFFNALIYACVGWTVWCVSRLLRPKSRR
jgi:hypothetical protein